MLGNGTFAENVCSTNIYIIKHKSYKVYDNAVTYIFIEFILICKSFM